MPLKIVLQIGEPVVTTGHDHVVGHAAGQRGDLQTFDLLLGIVTAEHPRGGRVGGLEPVE